MSSVLNADLYEIVPAQPYSSDDLNYNNDSCRANLEMNDEDARPEIAKDLSAAENADAIYIGYPIWWGTAPKIIYTFLESYDLSGKAIYLFCTSGGQRCGTKRKGFAEGISRIKHHIGAQIFPPEHLLRIFRNGFPSLNNYSDNMDERILMVEANRLHEQ